MAHQFKVGDYVRHRYDEDNVSRVLDVGVNQVRTKRDGWMLVDNVEVVRVTFPKPRRKLTLSQGLAWLRSVHGVYSFDSRRDAKEGFRAAANSRFAYGSTPCAAIIGLRKALRKDVEAGK